MGNHLILWQAYKWFQVNITHTHEHRHNLACYVLFSLGLSGYMTRLWGTERRFSRCVDISCRRNRENTKMNYVYHIEAETRWPPFSRRHFEILIFLNENLWISIEISLKFVPRVPINNMQALVQIMAWCRPGDKPLSEPMMVNLLTHSTQSVSRFLEIQDWLFYSPTQKRFSSAPPNQMAPFVGPECDNLYN